MGTIAKGVTSLFGGRARRREQKAATADLEGAKANYDDFQFKNAYADVGGNQAQAQGFEAAQLGPAAQAELGTLGDANTYKAQGYTSQGYDAAQADAAQAQKTQLGEDTGRTNQFAALQANTAQADRQAQESDQALAAALESGAVTGAGGATALAAAALKAKQGVADTIGAQESQNEQLRAQGATSVQQEDLAQRNVARQANIQQDQFNVGLDQQTRLANQAASNQASQFGAAAANQAAQFGASAANQAAQFGAQQANQFGLQKFEAENRLATANVLAQNQFSQANVGAQNQAAQFGASAANQASLSNAQLAQQAQIQRAQGAQAQEANQFGRVQSQYEIASGRKAAADAARQQATADLVGGVVGGIGQAATGGLFGTGKIASGISALAGG